MLTKHGNGLSATVKKHFEARPLVGQIRTYRQHGLLSQLGLNTLPQQETGIHNTLVDSIRINNYTH